MSSDEEIASDEENQSTVATPSEDVVSGKPVSGEKTREPTELPKFSEEPQADAAANYLALTFLSSLIPDDINKICYPDTLEIQNEVTKHRAGEFKVKVEKSSYKNDSCYSVEIRSVGFLHDYKAGVEINAYVDHTLTTLHQSLSEYVNVPLLPYFRTMEASLSEDKSAYRVKASIRKGEESKDLLKTIPNRNGLVLEAAAIMLERLIIRKNMLPSGHGEEDILLFLSLDTEGNLAKSVYKNLGAQPQWSIEGQMRDVSLIEKTLQTAQHFPDETVRKKTAYELFAEERVPPPPPSVESATWQMYFLFPSGQLAGRLQVGSPLVMTLTFIPDPLDDENEYLAKPSFDKKKLDWRDDAELYSKYIDRKDFLKSDHMSYIRQHRDLTDLISDFLQAVLLQKPDDTLKFAAEFFAPFNDNANPSPFADSTKAVPFQGDEINADIIDRIKKTIAKDKL